MAMQPFDPYYLYQPDERSNINTLFVSGLPDDVKAREIHNLFRRRPGFDSCQLRYSISVVAFATFFNHQSAMAALHALNGVKFDPQSGSVLHIELARSNSRRKRKPGGGAYVVIDKRSKGEANVQGSSSDDGESDPDERSENGSDHVDTATTQSGDAVVGSDNRVPVAREQHGKGGGDGGPCSTLFIANLGPNCTEDDLKQAFSVYAGFNTVKMRSRGGMPVAFADFETPGISKSLDKWGTAKPLSSISARQTTNYGMPGIFKSLEKFKPLTTFSYSTCAANQTSCDQLYAEKDKETLENKPPASSEALESLNKQMEGLSLMLHSAHDTISNGDDELEKIKFAAEEREKFHSDEKGRALNVIQEKGESDNADLVEKLDMSLKVCTRRRALLFGLR
ncbi:RNA-binding (RRM/RBD/RNP motifs) family protein [Trifolium repens]|nr:RNA-binding (RRM/RBD/RNP motifs) family protein [Trifolium repens]